MSEQARSLEELYEAAEREPDSLADEFMDAMVRWDQERELPLAAESQAATSSDPVLAVIDRLGKG